MMKSWTASSPGSLIRVRQATEFNPGRPIELVIDRDVLGWGADWRKALQEQVARTTFPLAMVTPGCVRSPACQEDFTFFAFFAAAATDLSGAFCAPAAPSSPSGLTHRTLLCGTG